MSGNLNLRGELMLRHAAMAQHRQSMPAQPRSHVNESDVPSERFKIPGAFLEDEAILSQGSTPSFQPAWSHVASQCIETLERLTGLNKFKEEARQAMRKQPEPIDGENPLEKPLHKVSSQPELLSELLAEPSNQSDLSALSAAKSEPIVLTMRSQEYQSADSEDKTALLLSHAGVGPGKLFQMLAGDPRVPAQQRAVFKRLQSQGAITRTLPEAQRQVDTLHGEGRYRLLQPLGVGTIGETYLAERREHGQENGNVVIKLIKKGVTAKNLDRERRLARNAIKKLYADQPVKRQYHLRRLDNLYAQWKQELDFEKEADNARKLADGATRYKVAQPLECVSLTEADSSEGLSASLVQQPADGIELKALLDLLALHRQDKAAYQRRVAPMLDKHPWLENPERWLKDLPGVFRDAYNEQVMRIESGRETLSHGDPHAGNVFVGLNPQTGKLEPTFIDVGLAVSRDSAQAAKNLGLLLHIMSGNTQALAESMVDKAEIPHGTSRTQLIEEMQTRLDQKLFKAGVNLTDCEYNQQFLETLLEEKGVFIPEEETAFFKAQLQAIRSYDEISRVVGQPGNSYLRDSLPDVLKGALSLLRQEPLNASRELWPVLQHVYNARGDAARNAYQFILPKPVEDGESEQGFHQMA